MNFIEKTHDPYIQNRQYSSDTQTRRRSYIEYGCRWVVC